MQLHQLRQIHKAKKAKRIGRGGKKGTYSGRGIKGQKSRSGKHLKPVIRELIKRYPKLRGHSFHMAPRYRVGINLTEIEKAYNKGETVNVKTLVAKKLISLPGQKAFKLKILGTGLLSKALIFENCQYTRSASAKIKKAKGTIK